MMEMKSSPAGYGYFFENFVKEGLYYLVSELLNESPQQGLKPISHLMIAVIPKGGGQYLFLAFLALS